MGSENLHEPEGALSNETKDMHRAVVSLMEELEAIDWYNQRSEACIDDELRAVLRHNRDEEIEHAMMVLEWIRRRNPTFDASIATYLHTEGPITEIEERAEERDARGGEGASNPPAGAASLGIGSLRG